MTDHLLSLLIFSPIAASLVLGFVPATRERLIKSAALGASLLIFLLSLLLLSYGKGTSGFQFIEVYPWISMWNSYYRIGVDGLSVPLVLLTTFLVPIGLLASWTIATRVKEFFILFLALEGTMIGAFVSLDLLLFYIFWEAMLIPMFFLVGVWGGKTRLRTAIKFFIFTMSGSLLLLLGVLILFNASNGSFDFTRLQLLDLPLSLQMILFVLFGISFFIKVPAFPLHSWLPDTHTEAPTAGSLILAAVLLKFGVYGLVRFCIPLFGDAVIAWQTPLLIIAVVGIVYGSLLSWVQTDIKRLVAYSSIAHMGSILLGIFSLNLEAMAGALFHMLSHGLTTGGLFLLVGMLYERTHTRQIEDYGGSARSMPLLAACFFIVTLGSIGLPGTNGFVGEFLILLGSFQVNPTLAALGTTGVILGAVYMLRLYQKVFFGPRTPLVEKTKVDLSLRELVIMLPIVLLVFILGVRPNPILTTFDQFLTPMMAKELNKR